MSFGVILDSSLDPKEEVRFKKKHTELVKRLSKETYFNYTEVESILLIYYKILKNGTEKQKQITSSQFKEFIHNSLDMTDSSITDIMCGTLSKGAFLHVSLETWTKLLSLFLRGTLEEQIKYCYGVYNSRGQTGFMVRDTMFNLLRTSIIGQGSEEESEEAVKDMIEVLTKKLDLDRDGKISFNDYKNSVLKQPLMLETFGPCLPSRLASYSFKATFLPKPDKL